METFQEYDTVMIPLSIGKEQEFAIMEEFDLEEKHYIVVSPVMNDEIQEGFYIYRTITVGEELEISRIEDADEFARVTEYFENR